MFMVVKSNLMCGVVTPVRIIKSSSSTIACNNDCAVCVGF